MLQVLTPVKMLAQAVRAWSLPFGIVQAAVNGAAASGDSPLGPAALCLTQPARGLLATSPVAPGQRDPGSSPTGSGQGDGSPAGHRSSGRLTSADSEV